MDLRRVGRIEPLATVGKTNPHSQSCPTLTSADIVHHQAIAGLMELHMDRFSTIISGSETHVGVAVADPIGTIGQTGPHVLQLVCVVTNAVEPQWGCIASIVNGPHPLAIVSLTNPRVISTRIEILHDECFTIQVVKFQIAGESDHPGTVPADLAAESRARMTRLVAASCCAG